jgi:hypothetical protein
MSQFFKKKSKKYLCALSSINSGAFTALCQSYSSAVTGVSRTSVMKTDTNYRYLLYSSTPVTRYSIMLMQTDIKFPLTADSSASGILQHVLDFRLNSRKL